MPPRASSTLLLASRQASRTLATTPKHIPFSTRIMSTAGAPSDTAQAQTAADSSTPSFSSIGVKRTNIETAPGVSLSDHQKVVVGSILDLFEGNPSLKHFSLWNKDATFTDNITIATGYPKYTAQFYGLPALFKPIQLQSYRVKSSGNPIELDMSNKYVVKGIKQEKVINSVVRIHLASDGKIDKVEDRWNGDLPSGAVSDAFRKLNAVTVPAFVKVPKNEEEDLKMKAEREKE